MSPAGDALVVFLYVDDLERFDAPDWSEPIG